MKRFLFPVLIMLVFFGCKKNDEISFPVEIDKVIADLTKSFDTLNNEMAQAALTTSLNVSDTAEIRSLLAGMYSRTSFATQFIFVSEEKIMQLIEPPQYYQFQGSDISDQAHVIKVFDAKIPVLSQTFTLVEGYTAAVVIHPVILNSEVKGAMDAVFIPEEILGRIVMPYVSGQPFEIWVMELGGNVLFDQDEEEIGLNVITDPLYQDFPELIAAANLINEEDRGETTYSFYQSGTNKKVTKKTYWKTVKILDNSWKIIWVKPE